MRSPHVNLRHLIPIVTALVGLGLGAVVLTLISQRPAGPLLATVAVGPHPSALALDGRTRRFFVLNRGDLDAADQPRGPGTVTVLDSETGAVLQTVPVGLNPTAALVDEPNGRLFVANSGTAAPGAALPPGSSDGALRLGTVSLLESRTGRLLKTTPALGRGPLVLALDRRHQRLLVAHHGLPSDQEGSLAFLDAQQGTVLGEARLGKYPADIAVAPDRDEAFVANFVSNTISVVDLTAMRVVRTIPLGPEPGTVARLALEMTTGYLIALSYPPRMTGGGPPDGAIHLIDARQGRVVRTITLPNPTALALDRSTGQVLVSSAASPTGRLTALDALGQVRWSVPIGPSPVALAVDEGAGRLFVADRETGLLVLETASGQIRCTLPITGRPVALALDPLTHRLFLVSQQPDRAQILNPAC